MGSIHFEISEVFFQCKIVRELFFKISQTSQEYIRDGVLFSIVGKEFLEAAILHETFEH